MSKPDKRCSMAIHKSTIDALKTLGKCGDSLEDIILRLVNEEMLRKGG